MIKNDTRVDINTGVCFSYFVSCSNQIHSTKTTIRKVK